MRGGLRRNSLRETAAHSAFKVFFEVMEFHRAQSKRTKLKQAVEMHRQQAVPIVSRIRRSSTRRAGRCCGRSSTSCSAHGQVKSKHFERGVRRGFAEEAKSSRSPLRIFC